MFIEGETERDSMDQDYFWNFHPLGCNMWVHFGWDNEGAWQKVPFQNSAAVSIPEDTGLRYRKFIMQCGPGCFHGIVDENGLFQLYNNWQNGGVFE